MSVPRKNNALISDTEKSRLNNPPFNANLRKRNNIIVKRKIQNWLNDAKDVLYALDHLKDSRAEDIFSDDDIFTLFYLIKKLLNKLNFSPVQGEPQHPIMLWLDIVKNEDLKNIKEHDAGATTGQLATFARRATPADLERNWQVKELVEFLMRCYPSTPEMKAKSPAYELYRKKREYREMKEGFARHGMRLFSAPDYEDMEAENIEEPTAPDGPEELNGLGEHEYVRGLKRRLSIEELKKRQKAENDRLEKKRGRGRPPGAFRTSLSSDS
jgi:hypothetical protein